MRQPPPRCWVSLMLRNNHPSTLIPPNPGPEALAELGFFPHPVYPQTLQADFLWLDFLFASIPSVSFSPVWPR